MESYTLKILLKNVFLLLRRSSIYIKYKLNIIDESH
jgi:hypothetical protein